MSQISIPYMQLRGGSSKGLYFLASDLPQDDLDRNQYLLDIMGRDKRQIDGLGGADALTSKVAIVSLSAQPDCDVDYLFVQIVVGENRVDTTPNCGNILAGIGPFAIESGLVEVTGDETSVRVHMLNSGKHCELVVQTHNDHVNYQGKTEIDGVPGSSAPVTCLYRDLAGSACGSLLPTGNVIDLVDGVEVTCVDNGMPVVMLRAKDMGIVGDETPEELNANKNLCDKLQSLRLKLGPLMNLGGVDGAAVPKMCLISEPRDGGIINTRTFIPYRCHAAIGVLGAVSAATACILPGSVASGMAKIPETDLMDVSVEHASGKLSIHLQVDTKATPPKINGVGLLRTARLLSRGEIFLAEPQVQLS